MGSLTLTISYRKNAGQVLSAAELKNLYLKNIPLTSPTGQVIVDDDVIDQYLKEAVDRVENNLNLSLNRCAYQENRDFYYDDWIQWGYMPVTYPVVAPYSVKGFFNTTLQISYPQEWLSSKKQSGGFGGGVGANDELYQRTINLVPLQGSNTTLAGNSFYVGVTPYIGYFGNRTIPNYWQVTYITGFNHPPASVIRIVALYAAIACLTYASANITGQAGIASKSIGIDGLSQSVTSTANAQKIAFGALIDAYQKQLDDLEPSIVSNYVGVTLGSL